MLAYPILWFSNAWRWLLNGWRALRRRRVDYVRFEISGGLPEFVSRRPWWQRRFLPAPEVVGLHDLRRRFQRIADDPQVHGVLLVVRDLNAGWARIESLRDAIMQLRGQGKRVVVYLLDGGVQPYLLACAADEILLPPPAFLNLLGLRVEATFLKDALALVGVEAEVVAVSPYKSAGDQFTRSDISPESREQLERILDARFAALVEGIAAGRGLSPEAVRELIDQAPFSAEAACQHGLLDGACYEDELAARLRVSASDKDPRIGEWDEAERALRLPYLQRRRKLVALISVQGAIVNGQSRRSPLPLPLVGGEQAGSDSIVQALRKAERSKRTAAVVLHVDSPGGDAYASDLIWREVLRLRQKKPVVVAMGNVAASGGYYVAAPASAIIAQPGTLTGSIGVVSLRPVAAGLYEKLGVNLVELQRGRRSGMLAVSRAPSDDERAALRGVVFTIYADFKRRVREGRRLSEEQLEPIAGGRVWTGREGLERGLVDALGGLPQAVAKAQQLAGLPVEPLAPLVRISGGSRRLPPQAFPLPPTPTPDPAALLALLPDLWQELMQTRVLTLLPFELREH